MAFLELDLRSGCLNSHEEVWVTLPDREPPEAGYETLWLFHGAHQDCSEWVRNSNIERFANDYGLAVVMPSMIHSYGMDMKYGADYFSMLTEELWYEARWLLPCLSRERERNFVAGASMGGYIAYKWALRCPERFGAAGSFSGSLDIVSVLRKHIGEGKVDSHHYLANSFGSPEAVEGTGDDLFYLAEEGIRRQRALPRFWCVCGKQDFGYELCREAVKRLDRIGLGITWIEEEGKHDFAFWDRQIEPFFRWLGLEKEVGR